VGLPYVAVLSTAELMQCSQLEHSGGFHGKLFSGSTYVYITQTWVMLLCGEVCMVVTFAPWADYRVDELAWWPVHVRNTDFPGKGNSGIFNTMYFSIESFSLLDMVFSGRFLVLEDTSPARISFLGFIPGTSTQPSHASLPSIVDTLIALERPLYWFNETCVACCDWRGCRDSWNIKGRHCASCK
jgi:hypothetical protein